MRGVDIMRYDYVKGYKSGIEHLPKEIREIVEDQMFKRYDVTEDELELLTLEVDIYINVDIRNYYKRK